MKKFFSKNGLSKILLLASLMGFLSMSAQEKPKKLEISGYVKLLGTFSHFNRDFLPPLFRDQVPGSFEDYQIHNRVDLKYYPAKHFSFGLGMRNRLFWGYRVQKDPSFYTSLNEDQGFFDLSYLYWKSNDVLLHTIFDRAWAQWDNKKWIVRLGRQRINWGVNTVWNPNDIFNQYNYFDFDYEERPGSDALRIQYFPNFNNTLEFAFSPARDFKKSVSAFLYKTNKWNYDFQFLGGYYKQDAVVGTGWAGNIWNIGFKGEANYYFPLVNSRQSNFTTSVSWDYLFGSGLYLQLGYLYNGLGSSEPNFADFATLTNSVQSAKNIFIFKHSFYLTGGYDITPLFHADLTTMFTPDFHNLIVFPTLSYSLGSNLDASFIVQYFMSQNPLEDDKLQWLSAVFYGRLKYSF